MSLPSISTSQSPSVPLVDPVALREVVTRALTEDKGPADVTTLAIIPVGVIGSAHITTKEECIISGLTVAERVFREIDVSLGIHLLAKDGQYVPAGTHIMEVRGYASSLLTAERTALNFLQHLSGIATQTRRFVDAVAGTQVKILDTRKTTPGLRTLEKYAVRCGGGTNHRFGLYDRFLIKDNHLKCLGDLSFLAAAVRKARTFDPNMKLEIEADTIDQVRYIAELGPDVILLDNMSIDEIRAAVTVINGRSKIEASGNMTLDRVSAVAATGVDFISVGSLTHSVKAVDMGLELFRLT